MQILNVRQSMTTGHVLLSARCKIRRIGVDDVAFRVPIGFKDFVCADASPFAAALLLPSMKVGEDLVIRGSISARLHSGMTAIVKVVSEWDIGLKPINIEVDELVADSPQPGVAATFFSGGVDSFYTFLRHQNEPCNGISHMVIVNGYDIAHNNPRLWSTTFRNVQEIAAAEGAIVIDIETNVKPLVEPILPWPYSHGGCLAAVALCLRNGISSMYFPSSYDEDHLFPLGSHPDINPRWSTESLNILHDGGETSRLTKVTSQIAHSKSALEYLRVCYLNKKGAYNCGRCDKCLRTMVSLYVAGVLDQAETFPRTIDPSRLATTPINGRDGAIFQRENLAALQAEGLAPDLQEALETSLSRVVYDSARTARKLYNYVVYLDHYYAGGVTRDLAKRFISLTSVVSELARGFQRPRRAALARDLRRRTALRGDPRLLALNLTGEQSACSLAGASQASWPCPDDRKMDLSVGARQRTCAWARPVVYAAGVSVTV